MDITLVQTCTCFFRQTSRAKFSFTFQGCCFYIRFGDTHFPLEVRCTSCKTFSFLDEIYCLNLQSLLCICSLTAIGAVLPVSLSIYCKGNLRWLIVGDYGCLKIKWDKFHLQSLQNTLKLQQKLGYKIHFCVQMPWSGSFTETLCDLMLSPSAHLCKKTLEQEFKVASSFATFTVREFSVRFSAMHWVTETVQDRSFRKI